MRVKMIAVLGALAMFVGCADYTRDAAIEQRIAMMPEGKEKTAMVIQYEQLRAQRMSAYAARSAAISAAADVPVYTPPTIINTAPPVVPYVPWTPPITRY
jgi:hypothetical protein